jgi:hypothetical protein
MSARSRHFQHKVTRAPAGWVYRVWRHGEKVDFDGFDYDQGVLLETKGAHCGGAGVVTLRPTSRERETPAPAACLHTSRRPTRPARMPFAATRPPPFEACAPCSAPPPPGPRTGSPLAASAPESSGRTPPVAGANPAAEKRIPPRAGALGRVARRPAPRALRGLRRTARAAASTTCRPRPGGEHDEPLTRARCGCGRQKASHGPGPLWPVEAARLVLSRKRGRARLTCRRLQVVCAERAHRVPQVLDLTGGLPDSPGVGPQGLSPAA